MTVWKPYFLMTLLVAVVVLVATTYTDVVIQEERDQRWAVSGIASFVPEGDQSWRLHLFGYQFRVKPEEIAEQAKTAIISGLQNLETLGKRFFNPPSQ